MFAKLMALMPAPNSRARIRRICTERIPVYRSSHIKNLGPWDAGIHMRSHFLLTYLCMPLLNKAASLRGEARRPCRAMC